MPFFTRSNDELNELIQNKNFNKRIEYFDKKYRNKTIIIYGAGILFDIISDNYDLSKLNIVAIVDKNKTGIFKNYKIIKPEDILEFNPDVILIATYMTYEIKKYLRQDILNEANKKILVEPLIEKNFNEKVEELFAKLCFSV